MSDKPETESPKSEINDSREAGRSSPPQPYSVSPFSIHSSSPYLFNVCALAAFTHRQPNQAAIDNFVANPPQKFIPQNRLETLKTRRFVNSPAVRPLSPNYMPHQAVNKALPAASGPANAPAPEAKDGTKAHAFPELVSESFTFSPFPQMSPTPNPFQNSEYARLLSQTYNYGYTGSPTVAPANFGIYQYSNTGLYPYQPERYSPAPYVIKQANTTALKTQKTGTKSRRKGLPPGERVYCPVACQPCFKAKIKCDKSRPCISCQRKEIQDQCIDRTHKTRGRPKKRSSTDAAPQSPAAKHKKHETNVSKRPSDPKKTLHEKPGNANKARDVGIPLSLQLPVVSELPNSNYASNRSLDSLNEILVGSSEKTLAEQRDQRNPVNPMLDTLEELIVSHPDNDMHVPESATDAADIKEMRDLKPFPEQSEKSAPPKE